MTDSYDSMNWQEAVSYLVNNVTDSGGDLSSKYDGFEKQISREHLYLRLTSLRMELRVELFCDKCKTSKQAHMTEVKFFFRVIKLITGSQTLDQLTPWMKNMGCLRAPEFLSSEGLRAMVELYELGIKILKVEDDIFRGLEIAVTDKDFQITDKEKYQRVRVALGYNSQPNSPLSEWIIKRKIIFD
ncbi:MAG: hypothetical protein F6K55_14730 [Moorea sp. SIO4A3]|nr:hypothetical protein [Moorena sp. SIO4A3]